MFLCTSAIGLESHVADDTKDSRPWTYKAISYEDPYHLSSMKHGCVSGLGCRCGCGTRQFLKKVGAGAAGLDD